MLHDAFLAGGAFVYVPDGVVVSDPIVVLHWCEGDGEASFPHTLVVLGERAEATVLDRFGSPDTDHLVERRHRAPRRRHRPPALPLAAGARPAHVAPRLPARPRRARRDACRASAVVLGGDYARLRSEALLGGQSAESDQLAVYFGDDRQMLDFRTLQDHDAPWTRSDLLFKGAVEDDARSVYSGLVRLRKTAQKSNAHQTNRNLVLTEGASAESIPNLEIEANDVRCSHASICHSLLQQALYQGQCVPQHKERSCYQGRCHSGRRSPVDEVGHQEHHATHSNRQKYRPHDGECVG